MTAYYEDKRTVEIEALASIIDRFGMGPTSKYENAVDELRRIVNRAALKPECDIVAVASLPGEYRLIGERGGQAWVQLINDEYQEVPEATHIVPVGELTLGTRI